MQAEAISTLIRPLSTNALMFCIFRFPIPCPASRYYKTTNIVQVEIPISLPLPPQCTIFESISVCTSSLLTFLCTFTFTFLFTSLCASTITPCLPLAYILLTSYVPPTYLLLTSYLHPIYILLTSSLLPSYLPPSYLHPVYILFTS